MEMLERVCCGVEERQRDETKCDDGFSWSYGVAA